MDKSGQLQRGVPVGQLGCLVPTVLSATSLPGLEGKSQFPFWTHLVLLFLSNYEGRSGCRTGFPFPPFGPVFLA